MIDYTIESNFVVSDDSSLLLIQERCMCATMILPHRIWLKLLLDLVSVLQGN